MIESKVIHVKALGHFQGIVTKAGKIIQVGVESTLVAISEWMAYTLQLVRISPHLRAPDSIDRRILHGEQQT